MPLPPGPAGDGAAARQLRQVSGTSRSTKRATVGCGSWSAGPGRSLVRELYGVEAVVLTDPTAGTPVICPVRRVAPPVVG